MTTPQQNPLTGHILNGSLQTPHEVVAGGPELNHGLQLTVQDLPSLSRNTAHHGNSNSVTPHKHLSQPAVLMTGKDESMADKNLHQNQKNTDAPSKTEPLGEKDKGVPGDPTISVESGQARVVMGSGKAVYSKVGNGTEQSPLLHYDELDPARELRKNPSSFRISQVILFLVFLVAGVALVSGLIFGVITWVTEEGDLEQSELKVFGGVQAILTSRTGEYRYAAVAADAGQCSEIGTEILAEKRGSVVDAAIASLLCLGIHNAHSMGIGGGHFMMVYDKAKNGKEKEMFSLDSRETAPGASSINMYRNASSVVGGLSIAVPGEIKGMHEVWKKFGRLPWKALFHPTIKLCREGYQIRPALGDAIKSQESNIRNDPAMRELYLKQDGSIYQEGEMLTNPRLADTLERVANEGAQSFYNGSLAKDVLGDLNDCGSIITAKDLQEYRAVWRKPSESHLRTGNYTVYTMPPPSSGPVLQYMLNILEGYNLKPEDIGESSPVDRRILTYHRIAEAMKFGYARRSFLGDPDFEDISQLAANLTDQAYANYTRSHITDNQTQPVEYYHPANHALPKEMGTSHLSIIGPGGEAVAVTSTINTSFGSKCRGRRTGIIFNDEMDDFNTPGDEKDEGFSAATANFIAPGKRPLSSMVPTIILNQNKEPVYIIGGSGGKYITSQTLFVTTHALWLGKKLNEAIDHPRLHHQLLPNSLRYEPTFDKEILRGLQEKGHKLEEKNSLAVVQGIYSCRHHCKEPSIYATSDFRKGGYPDGY